MGRMLRPSCKQCRREGMKLFLKGTRCNMAKCPIETGRSAPGAHGQRRSKKMSDYAMQLREKQKLRRQYGLQERQFKRIFGQAIRKRGVTGETLLQLLELRLDNIMFRAGFAASRKAARLFVTHGHVRVNGRPVNIPSMNLSVGDAVTLKENTKTQEYVKRNREQCPRQSPAWLELDEQTMTVKVQHVPNREEIAPSVNEELVVEFYSK